MPSLPEIAEQMRMDRDAGALAALETYQARLPEQALALAAIHAHLAASLRARPATSSGSNLEQASRSVVGLDTLTDPDHARHTIQGEIARGGMGVVFAARDEILRRDLAVKKVVSDSLPGMHGTPTTATPVERLPMLVRRLMEEAQVTAQLDHSGVVPVHELGVDDAGHVYFTMKRVRGRTLSEVFELLREGRGGWTLGRALQTFLKICETLAYAHGKGVIHRDLKPANVMVGTYGEVFVMDWGLAKVRGDTPEAKQAEPAAGSPRRAPRSVVLTDQAELARLRHEAALTLHGDVVGTLGYMPPEQARGDLDHLDERSDLWSLGAMLYELFARCAPYCDGPEGRVVGSVLTRYRGGPPTPLAELAPDAPPELVSIIERAMAHDPEQRFASAQELAGEIQAYLDGRVVRSHKTGVWVELRKWVMRNRAAAAGILAGVVLLAGGVSAFAWQQRTAAVRIGHERDVAEAQRKRAEGLRLAALSELTRPRNPAEAVEMALQSAELVPGPESIDALFGALRGHRLRDLLAGHEGYVTHGDFAGADRLVTGDNSGLVIVWDLEAGRALHWFDSPHLAVTALRLGPSRRRAAVGYLDGTVVVWDVERGVALATSVAPTDTDTVTDLAWTSDDELAVARASGRVVLHDVGTGNAGAELVPAGETGHLPTRLASARAGSSELAVLGPTGTLRGLDAQSRKQLWSMPPILGRPPGEEDWIDVAMDPASHVVIVGAPGHGLRTIAFDSGVTLQTPGEPGETDGRFVFSEDGSRIGFVIRGVEPTGRASRQLVQLVRVGDGPDYETVRRVAWAGERPPLAISPDGAFLISSEEHDARVLHASDGREAYALRGHRYKLAGALFSEDGGLVVTLNEDRLVRTWRAVLPGELRGLKSHRQDGWRIVHVTRDHTMALMTRQVPGARARELAWIDASTGVPAWVVAAPDTPISDVVRSPAGDQLIVAAEGGHVVRLDVRTGARASQTQVQAIGASLDTRLFLAPDGARCVCLSRPPRVYDTRTGAVVCALDVGKLEATRPAWSPDGGRIAVAHGPRGTFGVFDAVQGTHVLTLEGHAGHALHVIWMPDGRLATLARDASVRTWEASTGEQLSQASPLPMRGNTIGTSCDGRWLAFVTPEDVYLIDATSKPQMRKLATLPRDRDLDGLTFHPSARELFTVSRDGTIRTWQMDVVAQARTLRARGLGNDPPGAPSSASASTGTDPTTDPRAALAAAEAAIDAGDLEHALALVAEGEKQRPHWARLAYARARALALAGHADKALDALEAAIERGWFRLVGGADLATDAAFVSLRGSSRFDELRARRSLD